MKISKNISLNDKLSFIQTKNIYDYSLILKPLAQDFSTIFYQTMLEWCNVITSDSVENNKLWEVWLVKLGDSSIGICGLYTLSGAVNTKELWLGWLGLIPEYRNLKLGSQIMEHLYLFAKNVGCEKIFSYVDKEGKPLNFYKKEGFSLVCTVGEYCDKYCSGNINEDNFEDKEDYVIMKQLK